MDGRPAGEIQIVTADAESLVDYFNRIGADWRRYKEVFHDKTGGGMISDLMFNNRTTPMTVPAQSFLPALQQKLLACGLN